MSNPVKVDSKRIDLLNPPNGLQSGHRLQDQQQNITRSNNQQLQQLQQQQAASQQPKKSKSKDTSYDVFSDVDDNFLRTKPTPISRQPQQQQNQTKIHQVPSYPTPPTPQNNVHTKNTPVKPAPPNYNILPVKQQPVSFNNQQLKENNKQGQPPPQQQKNPSKSSGNTKMTVFKELDFSSFDEEYNMEKDAYKFDDDLTDDLSPPPTKKKTSNKQQQVDDDDFVELSLNDLEIGGNQFCIPFYQAPEMCSNEVRNWLDKLWFLPSNKKDIVWSPQNRFYYPVYVFSVSATISFSAAYVLPDQGVQNISETKTESYDEIIACASSSVDISLVEKLIFDNCFSHRTPYYLPAQDNLEKFTGNLSEKMLAIDISKDDVWEEKVLAFIEKTERKRCFEYIQRQYKINNFKLEIAVPKVNKESMIVVYLPISAENFQLGGKFYDTLTSGNLGQTVGRSPTGTGIVGETVFGMVSKVSNLVNDSIGINPK